MMHRTLVTLALIPFLPAAATTRQGEAPIVIRERDQAAACVIGRVAGERDLLRVQIRVPRAPADDILAKLPSESRDFSRLPVRVILMNTAESAPLVERRPDSVAADFEFPVVEGLPPQTPFVRVTFPRSVVGAASVIVAERVARANDGLRIATQTSCEVTEEHASRWR